MVAVKEKYVNKYFPYARLYLDDIRAIEDVLKGLVSEDSAIEIESENLLSHSLQEIVDIEANDRFESLRFSVKRPYVTVEIRRGTPVRVYAANGDDLQVKSAVARIDAILRRCQPAPLFQFLFQPRGAFVLLLIVFAGVALQFVGAHTGYSGLRWAAAFTIPLAFAALIGPFKKVTVVRLVERAHGAGFLRRNRDGLLLGTIFAALGALVSLVIALDLK